MVILVIIIVLYSSFFFVVPEPEVLSKIDVDELYSDVKRAKKGNKK